MNLQKINDIINTLKWNAELFYKQDLQWEINDLVFHLRKTNDYQATSNARICFAFYNSVKRSDAV